MTVVIVALLLLWLVLMAVLFVGATWLQGYIYSEPEAGMIWRAPAAGTAIAAVVVIWAMVDYGSIKSADQATGSYTSLFNFSADETKKYTELTALKDGKKTRYKLTKSATGQPEFRDDNRRLLPKRVDAIIVMEDEQEILFEPARDEQGNYKSDPNRGMIYRDSRGREMNENFPGEVTTARAGVFVGNMVLNLVHFAAWFLCLWLLLNFQWHHALGLAVVFWLIMTLLVMPMILGRVEDAARQRARERQASNLAALEPTQPAGYPVEPAREVV